MAKYVDTSNDRGDEKQFLDDLEGELTHLGALLEALGKLTMACTSEDRRANAPAADAIYIATCSAVEKLKDNYFAICRDNHSPVQESARHDGFRRCILPPSPSLCLEEMSIRDLALLADFFEGLSNTAVGFLNQPRFQGPADSWAQDFWADYLNTWLDVIRGEIQSRAPGSCGEAKARALALIRTMALDDDWEEVLALVRSMEGPFPDRREAA